MQKKKKKKKKIMTRGENSIYRRRLLLQSIVLDYLIFVSDWSSARNHNDKGIRILFLHCGITYEDIAQDEFTADLCFTTTLWFQ